jgi:hypothetical protein
MEAKEAVCRALELLGGPPMTAGQAVFGMKVLLATVAAGILGLLVLGVLEPQGRRACRWVVRQWAARRR